MQRLFFTGIAMLLLFTMTVSCVIENGSETQDYTVSLTETPPLDNDSDVTHEYLSKAPQLNASLLKDNSPVQSINALQLTTSWSYVDSDGNGSGYEADSPHPLQISDYSEATLMLDGTDGEIVLQFSDNYLPQSISVQRWNASLATGEQNIADALDKSTPVDINENRIIVSDDGCSYIYEVYALWTEGNSTGSSYYAFCTEGTSTSIQAVKPIAFYLYWSVINEDYPNDKIKITSVEQLQEYYKVSFPEGESYEGISFVRGYLSTDELPHYDPPQRSVADDFRNYDEEFFEDNFLLIYGVGESSGSNRHKIDSIDIVDNTLVISRIRLINAAGGTDDIAFWNIVVPLSEAYVDLEVRTVITEDTF